MSLNRLTLEGYIVFIKNPMIRIDNQVVVEFGLKYMTYMDSKTRTHVIRGFKRSMDLNGIHRLYKVGDHVMFDGFIFSLNDTKETVFYVKELIPIRTHKAVHNRRKDSSLEQFKHIPGFDRKKYSD